LAKALRQSIYDAFMPTPIYKQSIPCRVLLQCLFTVHTMSDRERRLRRALTTEVVPVVHACQATPRIDALLSLFWAQGSGGVRVSRHPSWKMCSPVDCRLKNAILTARRTLGTELCAVKVCMHKRQQRGGAQLWRVLLLYLHCCALF
jgi:hypothetical protein